MPCSVSTDRQHHFRGFYDTGHHAVAIPAGDSSSTAGNNKSGSYHSDGATEDASDSSSESSPVQSDQWTFAERNARSYMDKVEALSRQVYQDAEFMVVKPINVLDSNHRQNSNKSLGVVNRSTCSSSSDNGEDDGSSEDDDVISADSDPTVGLEFSIGLDTDSGSDGVVAAAADHGPPVLCNADKLDSTYYFAKNFKRCELADDDDHNVQRHAVADLPNVFQRIGSNHNRGSSCLSGAALPLSQPSAVAEPTSRPVMMRKKSSKSCLDMTLLPPTPEDTVDPEYLRQENPNMVIRQLLQRSKSLEHMYAAPSSLSRPSYSPTALSSASCHNSLGGSGRSNGRNGIMEDRYVASKQLISATRTRRKKTKSNSHCRRILKTSLDSTKSSDESSSSSSSSLSRSFQYPQELTGSSRSYHGSSSGGSSSGQNASMRQRHRAAPMRSSASLPLPERVKVGQDDNGWEHPSRHVQDQKQQQQRTTAANAGNRLPLKSHAHQQKSNKIANNSNRSNDNNNHNSSISSNCSLGSAVKFSELGIDKDEWEHPSLALKTSYKLKASGVASSSASVCSLGSFLRRKQPKKDRISKKCAINNRLHPTTNELGLDWPQNTESFGKNKTPSQCSESVGQLPRSRNLKPNSSRVAAAAAAALTSPIPTHSNTNRPSNGVTKPISRPSALKKNSAPTTVTTQKGMLPPVTEEQPHRVKSILKNAGTRVHQEYTQGYVDHTEELMAALRACEKPKKSVWRRLFGL